MERRANDGNAGLHNRENEKREQHLPIQQKHFLNLR
jgi:hypothetical protein